MMLAMGLGLSKADFYRIINTPKIALIALAGQMLLLPVLALTIASLFNLSPSLTVGLLLVALCPGGTTSNFFSHLGKGDAALSVSLTAVSSTLAVFTLPALLITLAPLLGYTANQLNLSFIDTIIDIALHTLLPLSIGMIIHQLKPQLSHTLEKILVPLSAIMFFVVIILLWRQNWANITASFTNTGLTTGLLLLASLCSGYGLAYIAKANSSQRFTLMMEVGIQNGALAFFIAVNLIQDISLIGPATVYTVAMVALALPLILLRRGSLQRTGRTTIA